MWEKKLEEIIHKNGHTIAAGVRKTRDLVFKVPDL